MVNFPNSFDTDGTLFIAVNNLRTTLTSSIDASTLTIPVVTTSGFPDVGFITILSDENDITQAEAIAYNSITSTTFSATQRGAGNTPALPHDSGDNVDLTIVAAHHNELKDAVIELEHFVGVSGSANFLRVDSTALGDLVDVTTAGATSGQVLGFNGSSWEPVDQTGGSGGGGAAGVFTFEQSTVTGTWVINHNLGTTAVNYIVLDTNQSQVFPDAFTVDNDNQVTIEFTVAQSGTAHIFSGTASGTTSGTDGTANINEGQVVLLSQVFS